MAATICLLLSFTESYAGELGELWVENRTNYEVTLTYHDTKRNKDVQRTIKKKSIARQFPDINYIKNMSYWSTGFPEPTYLETGRVFPPPPPPKSIDLSRAQADPKGNYIVVISQTANKMFYSEVKPELSKIPLPSSWKKSSIKAKVALLASNLYSFWKRYEPKANTDKEFIRRGGEKQPKTMAFLRMYENLKKAHHFASASPPNLLKVKLHLEKAKIILKAGTALTKINTFIRQVEDILTEMKIKQEWVVVPK